MDPTRFVTMTNEQLFDLDPASVEEMKLVWLRRRFAELRPRIALIDRLANDLDIAEIASIDDMVPICLPHTIYKSYATTDVEKARFDRLTRWLGTLSACDLSKVDVSGCETIEGWLDRIEAQTTLRPIISTSASGKISILPRTTFEEPFFLEGILRMLDAYRDEPGLDLRAGDIPFFAPWSNSSGRQPFATMFRLLRERIYPNRPDMLRTLVDRHISADELWLLGKLRRAESRGEELLLTPFEKQLSAAIAEGAKAAGNATDRFIEDSILRQRGKRVLFYAPWPLLYPIAKACAARGIRAEWSRDSLIQSGGGAVGEGWLDVINQAMPFTYPDRYREGYAMAEITGSSVSCAANRFHPLPWVAHSVVDPNTSQPLPRTGVQTGRLVLFDLLAEHYWGGSISGDEVTIDWDGGCPCGRKGVFFHNTIRRLGDAATGDDKITCSKTPEAYDRLVEFALGAVS